MRLPNTAHEAHPWLIAKIAPDFTLLDVWALPFEGSHGAVTSFLDALTAFDPEAADASIVRLLFAIRLRVGSWLGWDDPNRKYPIPGCEETSLSVRVPADLRATAGTTELGDALKRVAGGFSPLYRTDEEFAAEVSNATMHGILHVGLVRQDAGRYRAQLAVYVKPRGWFGAAYMKFIEPFRHFIVYPALIRQLERRSSAMRADASRRPA